jgi:hypothetical protein
VIIAIPQESNEFVKVGQLSCIEAMCTATDRNSIRQKLRQEDGAASIWCANYRG